MKLSSTMMRIVMVPWTARKIEKSSLKTSSGVAAKRGGLLRDVNEGCTFQRRRRGLAVLRL